MTEGITLYHYWRSSCSWRLRWAMAYKGIDHALVPVNLLKKDHDTEDYRDKNPTSYVPAVELAGKHYGESMAIVEWLEETYPDRPLLPKDALDRMRVRQLYMIISVGTQPIQNLRVLGYVSEDAEERKKFARHWIANGLLSYENLLKTSNPGRFSFGDQLTMADLCLIPQVYNALRFEIDMGAYPLIQGIYERCRATESCQLAEPEKFAPENG